MSNQASEPGIWKGQFHIRSFDVDLKQQASLEALTRYFLDAAWNHAEALGVGFRRLADEHKFWVLSRMAIRVTRYPRWGDTVLLRTWPRGVKSLFAMRDFEISDSHGSLLVAGSSAWLVLDARSHRPQRIEKLTAGIPDLPARIALADELGKLPAPTNPTSNLATQVRYSDIDVNGHVNSARYIGWLVDSYPLKFHREHHLTDLEINYIGELRGEDQLEVTSQNVAPLQYLHAIMKPTSGEACRARLGWVATPEGAASPA
jgi:medium-chain acyl-[acyl-carrier-protein] hydrolase